jgi:hypothetical protein
MPLVPAATVNPLVMRGMRMVWPRLVALRLDRLVVVEGRDLLLTFVLEDRGPHIRNSRSLGYKAATMALSPSRRYLLIGNEVGNWYEVCDADTLEPFTSVSGPDKVACAFASQDGTDVLVCAPRPGQLQMRSLPDGDVVAESQCDKPKPFVVASFTALGDDQTVAVMGHAFLGMDSAACFTDLSVWRSKPEKLADDINAGLGERGFLDVDSGPCGWEEAVLFEEGGRRRAAAPRPPALTVVALGTRQPIEQIAYDRVLRPGQAMMGTSLALVVGFESGLEVIPRRALTAERAFIPARAFSVDPAAGRCVIVTPECAISLVQLAKT